MSYFFSINQPGYGGVMAGLLALNIVVTIARVIYKIASQQ